MRLVTRIAPHLPCLRRFSHALTGTQQAGDAYVVAVLEALIADPATFDENADPKVALYRTYCRLWESISINLKPLHGGSVVSIRPSWVTVAERGLATMPPRARQAFLLAKVEGFQKSAIAQILNCDEEKVSTLIDEAASMIVGLTGTNVILTKDAPQIPMNLAAIVCRPIFGNCAAKRC